MIEFKAVVLLIDDQMIVAEALRRQLAEFPSIVMESCHDGEAALEVIKKVRPTVILQDLVMPGMSGIDLLERYRKDVFARDIPVIMLSSNEDAETKYKSFLAGANDYVVKFPATVELLGRIRTQSNAYTNLLEKNEAGKLKEKALIELQQKHKMESLGRLSAGLAHELNTPVQYIVNNLGFIENSIKTLLPLCSTTLKSSPNTSFLESELPTAISDSIKGIHQIAVIVKSMKSYCDSGQEEKKAVQILPYMEQIVSPFVNKFKSVAFKLDVSTSLKAIVTRSNDLKMAVEQVLTNAVEAINLKKATQNFEGTVKIVVSQEGKSIKIKISDNGCGIKSAIKDKVFDPFFTTKKVGQGTGQGLTLSKNIVENGLSGKITFSSTEGVGTEFIIEMPQE